MDNINIESAKKRYNKIMVDLGYEHNTIDTSLSEDTRGWNLRDMVAECDYVLSTFYEGGHCNKEMPYSIKRNYIRRLNSFIEKYKPYIEEMECAGGHCSVYDNHKVGAH